MSDAFRISLTDLRRQEGARLEVTRTVPRPESFATELVATTGDITVIVALQSVSEGVLVTGTVDYTTVSQCARCLTEVDEDHSSTITELYFYQNRAQALREAGDDEAEEVPLIVNDTIDMETLLRDTIVGQMPFIPLCDPRCEGLCAVCGERLADLPEDHSHDTEPDEMSPLDELRAKLVEEEQNR